jgi:hypothetical protein
MKAMIARRVAIMDLRNRKEYEAVMHEAAARPLPSPVRGY